MPKRVVGIFGGTFDPFHAAHLRMAQAFQSEAGLTELRLVPAGAPYHRGGVAASAQDRLKMVALGIAAMPGMRVDDRELRRAGASFTADTLAEIRAEIGPDIPLWFLIGGDSLRQLDTWRHWQSLFSLAHLAVAMRPGIDALELPSPVKEAWSARLRPHAQNDAASGTILRLTLPPMDISASAVRDAVGKHQSISHLVPPAVASYIQTHGLYRPMSGQGAE
ncbi:MAG: nicotinate-nucleotide adenylyltransferase [Paludibacterium sp.]|uniref:nicotinate-nucleotide adenylyltransferase n=1 Tax=Paludibacterium sp. TaxID=1917523 RepID=UPI0025DBC3E4|nr:nicotinate-nucleotide adenylyltransferase [Paludibacterium sp.]MBV8045824.1 nicotinate-nucleotide adenylyltransferase [Paludibacterium sp.]MBV8647606.1 nicotinate-nucleotide adenylyltransferase [Paludibacterium sp.]